MTNTHQTRASGANGRLRAVPAPASGPPVDGPTFAPVPAPNVHQRMLLTWAAIWPSVTFLTWLFGDSLTSWPMPLRTGLITLLVVTACVYVVVPALFRLRVKVLSAYRRRRAERQWAATH